MLLSIIIPVYNVEKYIERCILSCIMQPCTSSEYEIVVVNDGTLDSSMDIVSDIQKKYPHLIRTYSQTNQGLSAARNIGLDLARGKYVWFVDSDDWIEPNCLQKIIPILKDVTIDLLQLQQKVVYDDILQNHNAKTCFFEGTLSGVKVMRRGGLPTPAQLTICRKKFLNENKLSFVLGIYHEDSDFKPRATYLAKKIMCLDFVCYNYYQRQSGSITSQFRLKNAIDILTVVNNLYEFAGNIPDKDKYCFYKLIGMNINSLLFGIKQLPRDEYCIIRNMLEDKKHIFQSMIVSRHVKYMLEGGILLVNLDFGLSLHRMLR